MNVDGITDAKWACYIIFDKPPFTKLTLQKDAQNELHLKSLIKYLAL
jgi:hypothetical protein